MSVYNKKSWPHLKRKVNKVPPEHENAPALKKFRVSNLTQLFQLFKNYQLIPWLRMRSFGWHLIGLL